MGAHLADEAVHGLVERVDPVGPVHLGDADEVATEGPFWLRLLLILGGIEIAAAARRRRHGERRERGQVGAA